MPSAELFQILVGPVGALGLALFVAYRLWLELRGTRQKAAEERTRLLAELDREKDLRLEDARETTTALLQMQGRVLKAVELFEERPCIAAGFRQRLPTDPDLENERPSQMGPSLMPSFPRKSSRDEPRR